MDIVKKPLQQSYGSLQNSETLIRYKIFIIDLNKREISTKIISQLNIHIYIINNDINIQMFQN